MAALSDYLEDKLLNHLFRDVSFPQPSEIAIALTSGVPLDSDTGETLPELPSGVDGLDTRYRRRSLGSPNNNTWHGVGVDGGTAYTVYQSTNDPSTSGYFYPIYLEQSDAASNSTNSLANSHTFDEFPGVTFYTPASEEKLAQETNPGYAVYEGNGFIKNKSQIVFNSANTDWGWVSGIAILDSSEYGSGNMLMYAELTNPRYVYTGDNLKFDVKSLEICLK